MKWNDVISPVSVVTEDFAKEFIASHKTGEYQLLDVRLHEEYEEEHLPGAVLIPLNELMEGKGDLDPSLPTIVYCRSGGRSRAASQWLSDQGFKEVYDIGSNIVGWMGLQLEGGYDLDLNLVKTDADFKDAFQLSYAMEEGLQQFYNKLEEITEDQSHKKVYQQLVGYEDLHKDQLKKRFQNQNNADFNVSDSLVKKGDFVEGGESNRKNPHDIASLMNDIKDIWSLSLAIEAQSYDLYVRLANKTEDTETKKLFLEMADEEKDHMNYITKELSNHLRQVA